MMAGLRVRLVDTDPRTLNMNLEDLEAKIGPQTRAISLVHLMGNPCDMDRISEICLRHNLLLIEDCCESLGARFGGKMVGTFGLAGSYSFFFSHHLTTMEGGAIVCQDRKLSDLLRLLRAHGWARNAKYTEQTQVEGVDSRYTFLNWGFNVRPTELQAGFGLEQLKRMEGFHDQRRKNAAYLLAQLEKYSGLLKSMVVHPNGECSWFAMPIMLDAACPFVKGALLEYLEQNGVETRPVVTGNVARQHAPCSLNCRRLIYLGQMLSTPGGSTSEFIRLSHRRTSIGLRSCSRSSYARIARKLSWLWFLCWVGWETNSFSMPSDGLWPFGTTQLSNWTSLRLKSTNCTHIA
jgi:CDP-6-deoxy-D-xylo-4-hexulose-3-dehydrase